MGGISNDNKSYADDQGAVADVLYEAGGVQAALTVGTSPVEVRVGATPLAGRKSVTLFNNSINTIYWGWTNSVTVSNGTPIFPQQTIAWAASDQRSVFVIAALAGNNTRITEAG